MKFTLEIDCVNDAFDAGTEQEVHRILLSVARRITYQGLATTNTSILDGNGNRVGQWTYGAKK